MYAKLGFNATVASTPESIAAAERLILPGIGSFDACVSALAQSGLKAAILEAVGRGVPVLGICVGMQMLMAGSAEGRLPGLSLIAGDVVKFPDLPSLKVPHMGWNAVTWANRSEGLAAGLESDSRFYFVHSYFVRCSDPADTIGTASYGEQFAAAIKHGSVYGVQFHPEKSHRFGLRLLKNFASI
jgi:glutamine amidotransferase